MSTDTQTRPDDQESEKKPSGATTFVQWVGVVLVLLVGLALIFGMKDSATSKSAQRAPAAQPGTSAVSGGSGSGAPSGAARLLARSEPTAVSVPAISAQSSLIPTGLRPDGSLDVPPVATPMQASWYDRSPTPGEKGPSIVLGHINGNGHPGIFENLGKVSAGDVVLVDRADHTRAVFKVSQVDVIPKASFPTDQVYNDTPNSALRLITCGGDYDAANRNYLSNVIVYADLVDVQQI